MAIRYNNVKILLHRGRNRKPRPKTFTTEDAAHAWAKASGLKEYKLFNLRTAAAKSKKIRVVF
jgi:hypothetical protein